MYIIPNDRAIIAFRWHFATICPLNAYWHFVYMSSKRVCVHDLVQGDIIAVAANQVIEMKQGNTLAPYVFKKVWY